MRTRYQQSQQWLLNFIPEPSGKGIIMRVEYAWQTANSNRKLSLISVVCVAMVNGTLSCLVALQAKQKPRVLHGNKRYVVGLRTLCSELYPIILFLYSPKTSQLFFEL